MDKNTILKWNRYHAILMLVSLAAYLFLRETRIPLIAGCVSITVFFWLRHSFRITHIWHHHKADIITVTRLGFLGYFAFRYNFHHDLIIFSGLLACVCLDGLDGFVARKIGTSSLFGTYLDMETDALFVAVVSVLLFHKGFAGSWILVPGFMRYGYVLITALFGEREVHVSRKYSSVMAGLFFMALIIPFAWPSKAALIFLFLASAGIIVSFSFSFYDFFRTKTV